MNCFLSFTKKILFSFTFKGLFCIFPSCFVVHLLRNELHCEHFQVLEGQEL